MPQINFLTAVNFVLKHEEGVYKNPTTMEYSNFGITQTFLKSFPYFITDPLKLSREDAVNIYYQQFWHKYRLDLIHSIKISAKLMDMMISMGKWEAVKILQKIFYPDDSSLQDGALGPHTVGTLNQNIDWGNEKLIVDALTDQSIIFYNGLATRSDSEKLDGKNKIIDWLIRANDKL